MSQVASCTRFHKKLLSVIKSTLRIYCSPAQCKTCTINLHTKVHQTKQFDHTWSLENIDRRTVIILAISVELKLGRYLVTVQLPSQFLNVFLI